MNREIKFRAWQRNFKRMHPVRSIDFKDDAIFCITIDNTSNGIYSVIPHYSLYKKDCDTFNLDALCLMQFTGLTDKNGKDVYDGDIVRIHNYTTDFKNGKPNIDWRVFEVKHNQYLWAFSNDVIYMPVSHYDLNTLEPYDIEIIGNIHENPELLSNG